MSEPGSDIYRVKRPKKKWSARQVSARNIATIACLGKFDLREEGSMLLDDILLGELPPPQPLHYLDTLRVPRNATFTGIAPAMKRYKLCQALLPERARLAVRVKLLSEVEIPYERLETLVATLPREVVGAKARRQLRVREEEIRFCYEDGNPVSKFFVVWNVYLLPPIPTRTGNFPPRVKRALLEAANHKCQICASTERLEVDHIEPLWRGGEPKFENGQVLCRACHLRKNRDEARERASS